MKYTTEKLKKLLVCSVKHDAPETGQCYKCSEEILTMFAELEAEVKLQRSAISGLNAVMDEFRHDTKALEARLADAIKVLNWIADPKAYDGYAKDDAKDCLSRIAPEGK